MPNNVKNTSSTKYCLKDYKIIVKTHYFFIFLEKKIKDETRKGPDTVRSLSAGQLDHRR